MLMRLVFFIPTLDQTKVAGVFSMRHSEGYGELLTRAQDPSDKTETTSF